MIYRRSKIVRDQNYPVSKSKSYRHCKDLPFFAYVEILQKSKWVKIVELHSADFLYFGDIQSIFYNAFS